MKEGTAHAGFAAHCATLSSWRALLSRAAVVVVLVCVCVQCCSIEVNTKSAAVVAATMAKGGVCPLTGRVTCRGIGTVVTVAQHGQGVGTLPVDPYRPSLHSPHPPTHPTPSRRPGVSCLTPDAVKRALTLMMSW
jgi:hypothetical protein